jgi:hypothetical protein
MGNKPLIFLFLILLAGQSIAQTTFDPLAIAVGARALGMGKAYVAAAEDGEAVFTNPAGLGEIDSFKFTSMSGRVLEDVNYTALGGVYPMGAKSALGFGYAAANVPGIDIRDSSGTFLSRANYSNSVFAASYGRKLTQKLSLGMNLKYFCQDGTETNEGDGTGINLDIGFLQKELGPLSLGVVCQNILSAGKIRYKNGEEETLPAIVKVGARLYLLGEGFGSAIFSPLELFLAADADLSLQESKLTTLHLGGELSPIPYLTLRAGMDQDPAPTGIQSNFTAGLSIRYAGIGFHYAYHPYTEFAENAAHYFSISFDERGWPPEELPDVFFGAK